MIQSLEYASSRAVSQSELKLFRKNITAFFNQVELGEREKQKSSKSFEVGDLVDTLLTNPAGMENYHTDGISCSDALQEIVNTAILAIHHVEDPELKVQLLSSPTLAVQFLIGAARQHKWNGTWGDEAVGKNVIKSAGRFFELRAQFPDKVIVAPETYALAKKKAELLENDPITGPILRGEGGLRVENQMVLFGTYSNTEQKGLPDKVLFDDVNKIIYPYDIKTVFAIAQFISNYYKFGYGYQGSWYTDLLKQNYPDYTVEDFRFLVVASTTEESPLIFRMPASEIKLYAEGGYNRFGHKVIGWHESIMDLEWHRRTNNWMYPKSYYSSNELVIDSVYAEADNSDPL